MSISYIVYLQTTVNGEPVPVGPFLPIKGTDKYKYVPVAEYCSWYRDSLEWLERASYKDGLPDRMCEELADYFKFLDEENSMGYKPTIKTFKYSDIQNIVNGRKPFKYHGYLLKETIAAFEIGEIEEIEYWITEDEYRELDDESRKYYAPYEWNNPYDAYSGVINLVETIDKMCDFWNNYYLSGWSYSDYEEAVSNLEVIIHVYY